MANPIGNASLTTDPQGDDFIFRRTDSSGKTRSITLSDEDVLRLAQSAQALQKHILEKRSPKGGLNPAVAATPVARVGLDVDALTHDVLMTLYDGAGHQMTYSLVAEVARPLADRLPVHVAKIEAAVKSRTRQ